MNELSMTCNMLLMNRVPEPELMYCDTHHTVDNIRIVSRCESVMCVYYQPLYNYIL